MNERQQQARPTRLRSAERARLTLTGRLANFVAMGSLLMWLLAWGPLHARTDRSDLFQFREGFLFLRAPVSLPFVGIPLVAGCYPASGRSTVFYVNFLCAVLVAAAVGRRARIRRRLRF